MRLWDRKQECLSASRLRAVQAERLRALVARCAAHAPFYRDRLRDAGVEANSIQTVEDVRRLPFTTPDDLAALYPQGLRAVPPKDIALAVAVVTRRGREALVTYTRSDLEVCAELSARLLCMAGVDRDDVVQLAIGEGMLTEAVSLFRGVERIGARLMPAAVGDKRRQVKILSDLGATHLVCTPRYALELIEAAEAMGAHLARGRLAAGVLGGEPWSERLRQQIESRLGVETYDHYGPAELLPGLAAECRMRDGLHVFEDHVIAEVVDPQSGEPLPPETPGELVLTPLTLEGCPVLRYRTGDLTTLSRRVCDCGRTFVRMQRVGPQPGRPFVIRGAVVLPEQIEQALKDALGAVPPYQAVCDPEGIAEDMDLRVEVTPEMLKDCMRAVRLLQRHVRDHFLRTLSLTVRVTLVEPGTLPPADSPERRMTYAGGPG